MVHACQKTGKCASPEVKKTAQGISYKDADDFASTKHKGLPMKKKKKKSFKEWLEENHPEHKEPISDTFQCIYRTPPDVVVERHEDDPHYQKLVKSLAIGDFHMKHQDPRINEVAREHHDIYPGWGFTIECSCGQQLLATRCSKYKHYVVPKSCLECRGIELPKELRD